LDSTIPVFDDLCEKFHFRPVSFPKSPPRVQATFANGSEVFFRPAEDAKAARRRVGPTYSMLVWDQIENCDPGSFAPFDSRVSMENVLCQTLTASNPEGHDWVWHKFIDPNSPLQRGNLVENVQFTIYDNESHLPPGYIDNARHSWTEWEIKKYLEGSREDYAGLIYPMFNENIHVYDPEDIEIPASWPRYRAIDFGISAPTCCICAALSPKNYLFFYDEYYGIADSLSEHIDAIKAMCAGDEFEASLIDSSCTRRDHEKYGGWYSIADEFIEAGIGVMPATKDWDSSTMFLRWLMKQDERVQNPIHVGELGSPRAFFSSKCTNSIAEFYAYRTKESAMDATGRLHGRDGAHEGADHAIDPIRYIAAFLRPEFSEYHAPEEVRVLTPDEFEDKHCWVGAGAQDDRKQRWQAR